MAVVSSLLTLSYYGRCAYVCSFLGVLVLRSTAAEILILTVYNMIMLLHVQLEKIMWVFMTISFYNERKFILRQFQILYV